MKNLAILMGFLFIFAMCVSPQKASAQALDPCDGLNKLSDGICSSNPLGPGDLAGAALGVVSRLDVILGASGRGSIRSFERVFDNAPTLVQQFALRSIAPVVAERSGFDDLSVSDIRNFTSSIRTIEQAFRGGFDNIPCAAGLGASSLDRYTDYSQGVFIQSLGSLGVDALMERRLNVNSLRNAAISSVCSEISESL